MGAELRIGTRWRWTNDRDFKSLLVLLLVLLRKLEQLNRILEQLSYSNFCCAWFLNICVGVDADTGAGTEGRTAEYFGRNRYWRIIGYR